MNFINVLDAQRSLLTFEENQISSRGTITQDVVQLYKALGGGWDSNAEAQSNK